MNPLVLEWIQKAEGDFSTAGRELRARKAPNYDAACFHAQQCAEKYLKALLQQSGTPFGRTHNLLSLLELLLAKEAAWESIRPQLEHFNVFSVLYRYPGESADKDIAREALNSCKIVRTQCRLALSLD